jgi:hypothetical protein
MYRDAPQIVMSGVLSVGPRSRPDNPAGKASAAGGGRVRRAVVPLRRLDFKGARVVVLWSGKYDYRSPSQWDGDRSKYAERTRQMQQRLNEAKASGIRKAFLVIHYPVFARSGFGPTPEPDNPHKLIGAYAKDIEVILRFLSIRSLPILLSGGSQTPAPSFDHALVLLRRRDPDHS